VTATTTENITYRTDLAGVDWGALKAALAADRFDNGRTADQLCRSFENSRLTVLAESDGRVVGTARALSDGVCSACVVDVWTQARYRRRGIARRMMELLLGRLPGQHVYLFTDDSVGFYEKLGFREQPVGLGMVVGRWLQESA
jgi:predicted GNAT family acetyltransferase